MSTNTTRPGGTHENGITRPPLTFRERDALAAIIRHKATHDGNSPTYRDIATALSLKSTSNVFELLETLQQKGYITTVAHKKSQINVCGGLWTSPDLTAVGIRRYGPRPATVTAADRCRTCGNLRLFRSGECEACYRYRLRHGRPRTRRGKQESFGRCDCGQPATVAVITNHGQLPLCRSCARIELEMEMETE